MSVSVVDCAVALGSKMHHMMRLWYVLLSKIMSLTRHSTIISAPTQLDPMHVMIQGQFPRSPPPAPRGG